MKDAQYNYIGNGKWEITVDTKTLEKILEIKTVDVDDESQSDTEQQRRKKHMFLKKCSKCGKRYRGKIGLATHMVRIHSGKHWSIHGTKTPTIDRIEQARVLTTA